MNEGEYGPRRPKGIEMTNQERAEQMVQAMLVGIGDGSKGYYDCFLSHLDAAVSDALKDREVSYEKDLKMRIADAVANEFAKGALDQQRRCAKHCEQQRVEGFASGVREVTNSICDEEGHTLPCGCHCHRKLLIACNKAWFEGFASAIEAAAKVADEQSDDLETDMSWKYCAEKIAKSIRALRPTSEEGK